MTGKSPAKARWQWYAGVAPTVVLVLAGWLLPMAVMADFDGLGQQLRIEQHKSRFQLMLEQVGESARRRAAGKMAPLPVPGGAAAKPSGLGDASESVRLDALDVTGPPPAIDATSVRRLEAAQARERDQRRMLDQRQQRAALVAVPLGDSGARFGGFAATRREMVRFGIQNQRLSLQRKLRR